ncbi:MAG: protein-glutamate O-methyltransferase CheR [Bdellovibrionales bacterium]
MKAEDFDMIALLLKQRSGLVITKDKAYLLESRLMPVARKWSLKTLDDLATALRTQRDESLIGEVVDAMTTNETSFMRDRTPFDQFTNLILPRLREARQTKKHLRIWSAASSTGQEAYSLAMLLNEEAPQMAGWKIDILGTDISKEVIDKARQGIYSQFEIQRGLPINLLIKHFDKIGEKWQIKESMRKMVEFREGNLLADLGPIGVFDVIFCRNVLIYFDAPTKTKVLETLASVLAPDGVLYLGGAETVLGISEKFKPVEGQRGIYVLNNASAAKMYATGG